MTLGDKLKVDSYTKSDMRLIHALFGLLAMGYVAFGEIAQHHTVPSVPMKNTDGAVIGQVSLEVSTNGAIFSGEFWGISPGWHGIHLHENPDCSDPGKGFVKSGGHANPAKHQHGVRNDKGTHLGDLSNIYAFPACLTSDDRTETGQVVQARTQQIMTVLSAADAPRSFAVILHESADDYTTNPTGNSGKRIGCAVITIR